MTGNADTANTANNSDSAGNEITQLLRQARGGDAAAFDALVAAVYDELYRLARVVRGKSVGETLNTTALVHEAYIRLLPSAGMAWNDRVHFFRVAARAMRQVIVRAARDRSAQKRGGGALHVTLHEGLPGGASAETHTIVDADDVVALDAALGRLEALSPRQAQVVECRYFAGLSVDETAHALGVGSATVKRDWRTARAWLLKEMAK